MAKQTKIPSKDECKSITDAPNFNLLILKLIIYFPIKRLCSLDYLDNICFPEERERDKTEDPE